MRRSDPVCLAVWEFVVWCIGSLALTMTHDYHFAVAARTVLYGAAFETEQQRPEEIVERFEAALSACCGRKYVAVFKFSDL